MFTLKRCFIYKYIILIIFTIVLLIYIVWIQIPYGIHLQVFQKPNVPSRIMHTNSVQFSSTQSLLKSNVYSRIYLRGLKKLEDEQIQHNYIIEGIKNIENEVFIAAKKGLSQVTSPQFNGCEEFSINYHFEKLIDKDTCENIVNKIHELVIKHFPDSELLYDSETKQYTLKWD